METLSARRREFELCERLKLLTTALDPTDRTGPRRAAVSPLLVHRGRQPVRSLGDAFVGAPSTVEIAPATLTILADAYGVDPDYLLNPDPDSHEETSEQLRELAALRRHAITATTLHPAAAFTPTDHGEGAARTTRAGRRAAWANALQAIGITSMLVSITLFFGIVTIVLDPLWAKILFGLITLVIATQTARTMPTIRTALRFATAEPFALEQAIHAATRNHIGRELHHYLSHTTLPHSFFTAILRAEPPVSYDALTALAHGTASTPQRILTTAITEDHD